MLKGISTLLEYEECIKRGLCEEHLKEINQNEHAAMEDGFPLKAFRFVRINILSPILFHKPSKCEKIKRLMEKTPPIAKIFDGDPTDAADVVFIMDSVVIFTLCQLSKICCIGALFHTIKKTNCNDPHIKSIQNLLLVERFANADIRHLYPVLQKNFVGYDLDIIRATHCITLLFIRKFCSKPNFKIAVETIENDLKSLKNFESTATMSKNFNYKNYVGSLKSQSTASNLYSSQGLLKIASDYMGFKKYKGSALFSYLAVSMDHTCSQAYCLLVKSLINLKLYEDALAIVQYGLKHCKKDTKYYKVIEKDFEDIKSKYIAPDKNNELVNSISESSINNNSNTNEKIPIKSEKSKSSLVDLVDSDSAESDSEVSKGVPELMDAADSDEESESMVASSFVAIQPSEEKKPLINEAKEKIKNKPTGATRKKRTVSEGSVDIQLDEELDVNKINSFLKEASEALLADCGYKAVQTFRGPLRNFMESSKTLPFEECDIVCIKYSYGIAYCKSGGYDDLQKSITILKDIIENHDCVTFPAAYYSIGLAYRKLNRFKDALHYLEIVQNFLCKGIHFKVYPWPGMSTVIQETKSETLKTLVHDLIKECESPPNPDAFCRYANCSFQPTIYYTDPDFKGYISLSCSEQCCMQYHSQCWKAMKEEKNLIDKEFLEKSCFTPDCEGFVVKIQNIDKKGDLSKEFTSDFKKSAKQKWAKWEKKADIKEKEKKRKKTNTKSEEDCQDVLDENERVVSRKNSSVCDDSSSQFSGFNGFVQECESKISENMQKSQWTEKIKQNAEIDIPYSSNICSSSSSSVQECSDVSHIIVNDEEFTAKSTPENDSKKIVTDCIKSNVYSFMSDFLQYHGPLKINDSILINELASFPDEVHEVISGYSGIGEFLKEDLRFAFVGNLYICIISDLASAYQMLSALPSDFKMQPLEDADDSKYYDENHTETKRSSLGLNPDALEYTPVVSSNFKSSTEKFTANDPLAQDLDSKCFTSLPLDTHLDTFPEAELFINKSKSCEIVLNSKLQTESEFTFSASKLSAQSDKEVGRTSNECIYKSDLNSEPLNSNSLNQNFYGKINNICTHSGSVTETSSVDDNDLKLKFKKLESQLLPLLKQYYAEEMICCRQSDSSVKQYLKKEMTGSIASGTDVECVEKNKDAKNSAILDQENIIYGLKMEIYDLSKKNAKLQNELECSTKQRETLNSEMTHWRKNSQDIASKLEILKKEHEKKEQDWSTSNSTLIKYMDEINSSVEKLKNCNISLTEEKNSLQKNVEGLTSSRKKIEDKMRNALDGQEKIFTATIQALQKENAELKSQMKSAELKVLFMKKTEFLRRIEEKSLEAVEKRKDMSKSMTMMGGNLNPMVYNCMKMWSNKLISYVNDLSTMKLDIVRKIDEQIKKVENGASLKDLKAVEIPELPVVPSWENTFPNGPMGDKSLFNNKASSFNFGFNAGTSAQATSAAIVPPTASAAALLSTATPTSKIISSGTAPAKSIPSASVANSTIAPVSSMSASSIPPVLEANKSNKIDISNEIDLIGLNPTIQESFKNAMASINSFASSPYAAPSLDDEFDQKCVVFKHPDPISGSSSDLPKAPPGILNSASLSASARTTPVPDPVVKAIGGSGEKSYGSLDTVPNISPAQSVWELEKKKSSNKNSYEKLLNKLKEQFPIYSQEELISFVKEFREKRQGKLSGLPMDTIISQISAIIQSKKKVTEQKLHPKTTKVLVNKKLVPDSKPPLCCEQQTAKKKAWNIESDPQQKFSGSADDDCTICCDPMTDASAYKVPCGHAFHEDCIRQWLKNKSNCPVCRVLLLLPEEYPSLS